MKRNRRFFTLLEVMIVIFIITLATGALGFKFYGLIEKKRFSSDVDRFISRLQTLHVLSMSLQQDLVLHCEYEAGKIVLSTVSLNQKKFFQDPPLTIDEVQFILSPDTAGLFDFTFYSSGVVSPFGVVTIVRKDLKTEVVLADVFSFQEGQEAGPLHPLKKIEL